MVQVRSCHVGVETCSLNHHELVPTVTFVKHVWEFGQCLQYVQELQGFLNQVLHLVTYHCLLSNGQMIRELLLEYASKR